MNKCNDNDIKHKETLYNYLSKDLRYNKIVMYFDKDKKSYTYNEKVKDNSKNIRYHYINTSDVESYFNDLLEELLLKNVNYVYIDNLGFKEIHFDNNIYRIYNGMEYKRNLLLEKKK